MNQAALRRALADVRCGALSRRAFMDNLAALGKLTLTVRGESPVLSQAAGLAGRGLALDLPAWAAPASPPPAPNKCRCA